RRDRAAKRLHGFSNYAETAGAAGQPASASAIFVVDDDGRVGTMDQRVDRGVRPVHPFELDGDIGVGQAAVGVELAFAADLQRRRAVCEAHLQVVVDATALLALEQV